MELTRDFPVTNFVSSAGSWLDAARLSAPEQQTASSLRGHFALHYANGNGQHLLLRDPLGVNKLFFALDGETVHSSNFLIDVVKRGFAPGQVWSVPSGHRMSIDLSNQTLSSEKSQALPFGGEEALTEQLLSAHGARIRAGLDEVFASLAAPLAGRQLYVTLSGGLDSSSIAALTRQHIGPFTAVTFAVAGDTPRQKQTSDLYFAERVARELGVTFEVVEISLDDLEGLLDDTLLYGQDFRDFNVHCGLVNAALAKHIAAKHVNQPQRPVVLTGDTMNELVADYTPVQFEAQEFYSLPKLPPSKLRRFLIAGLDTGDREVGIFARFGVDALQPYAIRPELFTALPGAVVEGADAKQRLARQVMGTSVPAFVYDRPKVRAQVANSGEVGGTLAALERRGIDAAALFRRFCELTGFEADDLRRWIRGGLYRFPVSFPKERTT